MLLDSIPSNLTRVTKEWVTLMRPIEGPGLKLLQARGALTACPETHVAQAFDITWSVAVHFGRPEPGIEGHLAATG